VIYRIRAAGLFPLPANADALAPWIDRVMSFDRLR